MKICTQLMQQCYKELLTLLLQAILNFVEAMLALLPPLLHFSSFSFSYDLEVVFVMTQLSPV